MAQWIIHWQIYRRKQSMTFNCVLWVIRTEISSVLIWQHISLQVRMMMFKDIYCTVYCQEEFEDTKGVIRIHISKRNKQHNGQKKKVQKDKQRSTKHTHKTKDQVTRTPLKTGGELRCSNVIRKIQWNLSMPNLCVTYIYVHYRQVYGLYS